MPHAGSISLSLFFLHVLFLILVVREELMEDVTENAPQ